MWKVGSSLLPKVPKLAPERASASSPGPKRSPNRATACVSRHKPSPGWAVGSARWPGSSPGRAVGPARRPKNAPVRAAGPAGGPIEAPVRATPCVSRHKPSPGWRSPFASAERQPRSAEGDVARAPGFRHFAKRLRRCQNHSAKFRGRSPARPRRPENSGAGVRSAQGDPRGGQPTETSKKPARRN